MRLTLLFAALLLLGLAGAAQPVVGGVANAASLAPAGLPNAPIAQGSLFTVFGTNLGPARLQFASFPLPTTLGGTSVQVTVAGQTRDAILLWTSAGQLAALLPSDTPAGTGSLRVTYNGQQSGNAVPITVVPGSFGTFALNQAGSGQAVVFNFNETDQSQTANSLNNATAPGRLIVLYGTGLGPITGSETQPPNTQNRTDVPVEVLIGGQRTEVLYRGRQGSFAGLDQLNLRVPAGVEGCRVPLVVRTGAGATAAVSNSTTIAVAVTPGTACSDPAGYSAEELQRAQQAGALRTGVVKLSRITYAFSLLGIPLNGSIDTGTAAFGHYTLTQLQARQGGVAPGSCTVYSFRGADVAELVAGAAIPPDVVRPERQLNAGTLTVSQAARGARTFVRGTDGTYSAELGGGISLPGAPAVQPAYLEPGTYTVNGSGTAETGAFSTSVSVPATLSWTEQSSIRMANRNSDLRLSWTGGDPDSLVAIIGFSTTGTGPDAVGATFVCRERVSRNSFTVPSYVLQALPVSQTLLGDLATGGLLVGTAATPVRFSAPNLDAGLIEVESLSFQPVAFR